MSTPNREPASYQALATLGDKDYRKSMSKSTVKKARHVMNYDTNVELSGHVSGMLYFYEFGFLQIYNSDQEFY